MTYLPTTTKESVHAMSDDPPQSQHLEDKPSATLSAPTGRLPVCLSNQLENGGKFVVDVENITIGLFRLDETLYAYENTCAHQGGPVCQGRILPGVVYRLNEANEYLGQDWNRGDMHIVCPWHGVEYSIKTGEHAGYPPMRLKSFPVEERDGVVYVQF
jgi:nitrite reductase/ring-hydroxylating ferredoxin subunit